MHPTNVSHNQQRGREWRIFAMEVALNSDMQWFITLQFTKIMPKTSSFNHFDPTFLSPIVKFNKKTLFVLKLINLTTRNGRTLIDRSSPRNRLREQNTKQTPPGGPNPARRARVSPPRTKERCSFGSELHLVQLESQALNDSHQCWNGTIVMDLLDRIVSLLSTSSTL